VPKSKTKKKQSKNTGGWAVNFDDGTRVETGYYPNPRMAVAEALKRHPGKVKSVNYIK